MHKTQKTLNNDKRTTILIFFLTLAISTVFFLFSKNLGAAEQQTFGTDYARHYAPTAESLLQGKGVPFKSGIGTHYPIGYPAFLTLPFLLSNLLNIERTTIIRILNILITGGSVCLLYLIAKTFLSKKVALIGTLLFALYPFNLWLIKLPNSEIPFMFLFYAGMYTYLKLLYRQSFKYSVMTGLFFGLATLIRPISLILPLFLSIIIFFYLRKKNRYDAIALATVLIITYSLVLLPWIVFIYLHTGKTVLMGTVGLSSIVLGMKYLIMERTGGVISNSLPQDVVHLIKTLDTTDISTMADLGRFVIHSFTTQTLAVIKLIGIKLIRTWYGTSEFWYEKEILLFQIPYLVSALTGIFLVFKKITHKIIPCVLLATVLYFWGMTVMVLSIVRYMVPSMAFLMLFSGFTIYVIFSKIKKSLWRQNKLSENTVQSSPS